MVPLSPHSLIIAARALVIMGAQDDQTFGDPPPKQPGAQPDSAPRDSWDLKFVHRCGFSAHYDQGSRTSSWPFPQEMTTAQLAMLGNDQRIMRDVPAPGDLFLMYSPPSHSFTQVGIVVAILGRGYYNRRTPYFDLYTIVGDTDETGLPGRGRAMRLPKRLSPAQGDRFLRWADLDAKGGMITYNRSTFLADARRTA